MSIAVSGVRRRKGNRPTVLDQQYLNPNKGLDVFASEQFIGDLEANGAMNCQIIETGCVSKMFGWAEVGTGLQGPPRGLLSYYPTGSDPMLCTIDSNVLKYLHGSIWTAVGGGITFGNSDRICGVQAGGAMWVWNSVDSGTKLQGVTASRPTTTVRGGFGIYFADKQIVSGVAEHPNRLYISSPLDVGDFTNANPTGTGPYSVYDATTHPGASTFGGADANYIDIALDDGDKITGLFKYSSQLIITKQRAIYAMSFDSNGNPTVTLVTSSIGCVSHWSIDAMDNDVIFQARRGYYIFGNQANFQNQLRTNELSVQVRPLVKSILPSNLKRSTGIWHDNCYYGAAPLGNSATNNRVFTYQRTYPAWFQHNNVQANAFTEFTDVDNIEKLYYADELTAKVWVQTTGYNHGDAAIDMFWESKAYDFGHFGIQKRYVDTTLLFRQLSGSVDVTLTIDGNKIIRTYHIPGTTFAGGLGRAVLGRALLGGKSEVGNSDNSTITNNIPIRLDVGEIGRTIKIKVANSNPGENFVLLGYNFGFRPYGRNTFPAELRIYG